MIQVGLFLFNNVGLLDFAGPYEVFTTATRVALSTHPQTPFNLVTLSQDNNPITARAGLQVKADHNLESHPALDLLLIPGGVVDQPLNNPNFITWLAAQRAKTRCIGSICTGAFLLAKAGLLDNLEATTHWEDIDELRENFPTVKVISDRRYIDHDHTITSAGIAAGIDMSLHLVAKLSDLALAKKTARQMEYPWAPSG